MTSDVVFHAGKPEMIAHPVVGGDALSFPITPAPPRWWWIAMRRHAGASSVLIRPWDQESDNRFVVECPSLEKLTEVIDAIDAAVSQSNSDYEAEIALRHTAAEQLKNDQAEHGQDRTDIQQAIDKRYGGQETVVASGAP